MSVTSTLFLFSSLLSYFENVLNGHFPSTCYTHSERLGFLTTSPENLGTAMRISMTLHLPALSELFSVAEFDSMGTALDMLCVPANLEGHDASKTWTFTTTKTLGISEVETAQKVIDSLIHFAQLEAEAFAELAKKKGKRADCFMYPNFLGCLS